MDKLEKQRQYQREYHKKKKRGLFLESLADLKTHQKSCGAKLIKKAKMNVGLGRVCLKMDTAEFK